MAVQANWAAGIAVTPKTVVEDRLVWSESELVSCCHASVKPASANSKARKTRRGPNRSADTAFGKARAVRPEPQGVPEGILFWAAFRLGFLLPVRHKYLR